ncbi:MAG TPA: hypothetical protein VFX76_08700 [Roseiflexaceae bacterium]|nr:hypothetical protein [Roseiflexaceae bacterium]
MSTVVLFCLAAFVFVALMLVLSAIKIVPEYERGVVFRLGRLVGARAAPACSCSSRSLSVWCASIRA